MAKLTTGWMKRDDYVFANDRYIACQTGILDLFELPESAKEIRLAVVPSPSRYAAKIRVRDIHGDLYIGKTFLTYAIDFALRKRFTFPCTIHVECEYR